MNAATVIYHQCPKCGAIQPSHTAHRRHMGQYHEALIPAKYRKRIPGCSAECANLLAPVGRPLIEVLVDES